MKKTSFPIPIRDNNGRPFSESLLAQLEDELLDLTGGFTVSEVRGRWREGARTYADMSRRFEVSGCDVEALLAFLVRWSRALQQEAIYLEVVVAEVVFVRPNDVGSREPRAVSSSAIGGVQ